MPECQPINNFRFSGSVLSALIYTGEASMLGGGADTKELYKHLSTLLLQHYFGKGNFIRLEIRCSGS